MDSWNIKLTVPQIVDTRPTLIENLHGNRLLGVRFEGDKLENESVDDCIETAYLMITNELTMNAPTIVYPTINPHTPI